MSGHTAMSEHAGTAGRIVNSIRAKDGDQWSVSRSEAIESVETYAAVIAGEALSDSHAELVKALEEIADTDQYPDSDDTAAELREIARAALAKATPSRNQVADISQRRVTKPCGHRDCEFPKCDCEEAST